MSYNESLVKTNDIMKQKIKGAKATIQRSTLKQ